MRRIAMKNKRYFFKTIALLLTFIITINTSITTYANNNETSYSKENSDVLKVTSRKSWKDKISVDLQTKMDELKEKGLTDEKIKVCIWYNDINQTEVDKQVKEETGLTRDNIDSDIPMPDEELLEKFQKAYESDFTNETAYEEYRKDMQQYLSETEKERKEERNLTDKYNKKRREIAQKKYKEKTTKIVERLNIASEDIFYQSRYAPMVIAKITTDDIINAAMCSEIEIIDVYYELESIPDETSLSEMKNTNGFIKISNQTGLTGNGVKIGIVDYGAIQTNTEIPDNRFTHIGGSSTYSNYHIMNSSYIIGGTNGIAHNSTVYTIDFVYYNDYCVTIEMLLDMNVSIINMSLSTYFETYEDRNVYNYTLLEKWLDHIAVVHDVTIVKSAGNIREDKSDYMPNPSLAYNVITVGAMNDNNTSTQVDDNLYDYSLYKNASGCEKPDLLATGNVLIGGTSSSTPVISGVIALMLELKPALVNSPEIIKAILQAACHRKVIDPITLEQTETMPQGLTDKQGAGVVDIAAVINIISNNQYGSGILTGDLYSQPITLENEPLSYTNLSVAWLQNNIIEDGLPHTDEYEVSVGTIQDINLSIYNNSNLLKTSTKTNSSTEMVYFPLSDNSTYEMVLNRETNSTEEVRFGYAWSTMADQICPKGDVNLDMEVTSGDGVMLKNYISGTTSFNELQTYLADCNSDGTINMADLKWFANDLFFIDVNKNGLYTEQDIYDALDFTNGRDCLTEVQWRQIDFNNNSIVEMDEFNMLLYGYYLHIDDNLGLTRFEFYTELLQNLYTNAILGDMDHTGIIDETDLLKFKTALEGKSTNYSDYIFADIDQNLVLDATDAAVYEANYMSDIPFTYTLDTSNKTMTLTGAKDNTISCMKIAETYAVNRVQYTVTSIAENAFSDCANLEEVYIPDSVTHISASKINKSPFYGTNNYVLKIYCEATVKPDAYGAYWNAGSDSVFSYSMKNADDYFYYSKDSSTKTLTITGVKGNWYEADEEVIIDDRYLIAGEEYRVTAIGDYAFYCTDYIKFIELPAGIEIIGREAFADNAYLDTVYMYRCVHLREIKEAAFAYCFDLFEVYLHDSVEIIHADTVEESMVYQSDANVVVNVEPDTVKPGWGPYWNYLDENTIAETTYSVSL